MSDRPRTRAECGRDTYYPTIRSLYIVDFSSELSEVWDDFIHTHSRNGNVFHERTFLAYHEHRFEDCSILISDAKDMKLLAVIPAALERAHGKTGIVSHPGSTYGGIIYHDKINTRRLKDIIDAAIRYYHLRYNADYFQIVLPEHFQSEKSFEDLIFLLWHRGFELKAKEASCVKSLHVDDLYADISRRTRTYIHQYVQSSHDIHFEMDVKDIEGVYSVIKRNLLERYHKAPTHALDELVVLKHMIGSRLKLFTAKKDDAIIAAVVVFELNNNVAHDFYIAKDYTYEKDRALQALFLKIFEYYRDRGFSYFNFGISSRKKWIKWGIHEFKERLGGRVMTRDTWILNNLHETWPHDGRM